MQVSMKYSERSHLRSLSGGDRILELAPNLSRDSVGFDAAIRDPIRFREAISALHDVVVTDLRFSPRDKSRYEEWKRQQGRQEADLRDRAMQVARETVLAGKTPKPDPEQVSRHKSALKRYWNARSQLNSRLRKEDPVLWRKLMPCDPVITVADDVVFFECFSADESAYGCLSADRDAVFEVPSEVRLGTTNVDYSWNLYDSLQSLRTYRETRFRILPEGLTVRTSDMPVHIEEKIDLPDGWLRGFLQLQSAMALPMKKVTLSISAMYSLLSWLRRHREKSGPRAIRFELQDGRAPRLVAEPWEVAIENAGPTFKGGESEPIRVWGRRRLLSLARVLPIADHVDVYLLGTGLPSFWVVRMGSMRLTLGLSGWTTNDWTRGSSIQMLLPTIDPDVKKVATAAEILSQKRSVTLSQMSKHLRINQGETASCLNQLALRGQVIFDLSAGVFRWRQVLPMAVSDRELGPPHPETEAGRMLAARGVVKIETRLAAPRGGIIVTGKAENQTCEVLIDDDGVVRKGKCRCSWHFRFGVRNGPCRHLQALRDQVWMRPPASDRWYEQRLAWSK